MAMYNVITSDGSCTFVASSKLLDLFRQICQKKKPHNTEEYAATFNEAKKRFTKKEKES